MGFDPLIEMAKRLNETEMPQKRMQLVIHRWQAEFVGESGTQVGMIIFVKRNHIAISSQSPSKCDLGFLR